MSAKLVVGLDGEPSGGRALAYAQHMAKLIGSCEIIVVFVVEWSPYSFQTAEENAARHKRREAEISIAMERVVQPALDELAAAGLSGRGIVRHGDVADTINRISVAEKADQIIVARSSEGGFVKRMFGSATGSLVMSASVPLLLSRKEGRK